MENFIAAIAEPGEEWKPVMSKGVRWWVSNHARVYVEGQLCTFTRKRLGQTQTMTQRRKGGLLAACKARHGYLEVARKIAGGKRVKERVHRLVGLAFVPEYAEGLSINHIDGNKLNNLPSNLEWVSLAENTRHQWGAGLIDHRGEKHPQAKLTSKQVVYMRRLYRQGVPAHTLDIIAGVSPGYTSQIVAGLKRRTG